MMLGCFIFLALSSLGLGWAMNDDCNRTLTMVHSVIERTTSTIQVDQLSTACHLHRVHTTSMVVIRPKCCHPATATVSVVKSIAYPAIEREMVEGPIRFKTLTATRLVPAIERELRKHTVVVHTPRPVTRHVSVPPITICRIHTVPSTVPVPAIQREIYTNTVEKRCTQTETITKCIPKTYTTWYPAIEREIVNNHIYHPPKTICRMCPSIRSIITTETISKTITPRFKQDPFGRHNPRAPNPFRQCPGMNMGLVKVRKVRKLEDPSIQNPVSLQSPGPVLDDRWISFFDSHPLIGLNETETCRIDDQNI